MICTVEHHLLFHLSHAKISRVYHHHQLIQCIAILEEELLDKILIMHIGGMPYPTAKSASLASRDP